MKSRKKNSRRPKSSPLRKRRLAQKQSNALNFEALEPRHLLAAITVGNSTDVLSPTADTSSIAALIANDGGDGISLREAIAAANVTVGEDTITFDTGVFTGGDNSLIRLTQGELLISGSLNVDGSSVGGVVITGDADDDDITVVGTHVTDVLASFGGTAGSPSDLLNDNSRVVNFSADSGDLTLTGLTITGGRFIGGINRGGGIRFDSTGVLTLSQSTLSGNSTTGFSGGGGGIYTEAGDVSLINSTVSGNSTSMRLANVTSGGAGGGIFTDSGDVSLTNSTVSGNSSVDEGGGIRTYTGYVSLINSTVSGNSATGFNSDGGGIYTLHGNVSLMTNSTVSGNSSADDGGGIHTFSGDVTLVDSAISGNFTTGSVASEGGGIRTGSGDVSLNNSTVYGNSSIKGGGIRTYFGSVSLIYSTVSANSTRTGFSSDGGGGIATESGNVSLVNSIVSSNSTSGSSSAGGGIYTSAGDVSLTDSEVSENSSEDHGGGIYARSSSALVSLTNSIVSGNISGDQGGGIRTSGTLSLTGSTVSDNSSVSFGGGIFGNFGNVSLTNSTVGGNSSLADGGGINAQTVSLTSSTVNGNSSSRNAGGVSARTVSLSNSTVSGNSSGGDGGGVLASTVSLTNSTVSGNSSGGDGGGILSNFFNPTVLLVNSTVTANSASGLGGGIIFDDPDDGHLTLHNSIVAGNADIGTAPDITAITDMNNLIVEHSLIGDTTGSGIIATTGTGNILNQLPMLGALADNGGPTQTHALFPGSPAIDAGNSALAIDVDVPLASDQRGGLFTRSFDDPTASGAGVDIGAFELRVLLVDNPIDEDDGNEAPGDLSLREAVRLANGNPIVDAITFDSSVFTGGDNSVIRLTQGELPISERLTIGGTPVGGVVITGDANDDDVTVVGTNITDVSASFGGTVGASDDLLDDNSRVLNFSGSGNLVLSSVTITGGRTTSNFADGGGIYIVDGSVFLTNSTVGGNSTAGNGADGGGIGTDSGDVFLTNSTVSGNSAGASADGGGIGTGSGDVSLINSTVSGNSTGDSGGGIGAGTGNVSLINSTLSGNISAGDGGGIWSDDSTILVVNSTVTGNSASGVGGGITFNVDDPDAERLTLHNSIVASNTDNGTAPDLLSPSDAINDLIVEYSLIGDTTGSSITATTGVGNILNQPALIGPLADNGGSTLTHAVLPDSPADDAGSNGLALDENGNPLATDQRGEDRINFGTIDIGAVETQLGEGKDLVVTIAQDVVDYADGFTSLREAITFANADVEVGDVGLITFDAGVFTGGDNSVIRLTEGELSISTSLVIDGSSVGGVVITGDSDDDDIVVAGTHITDVSASFGGTAGDLLDDNSRVLNFSGSGNLTLTGLTITGGRIGGSEDGGGIYTTSGSVALVSSTVSGNSTSGFRSDGGGIAASSGNVSLTNSTVSGNSSGRHAGGIWSNDSTVLLVNSTVTGNSASRLGGGIHLNGLGFDGDPHMLQNSIVAGNVDNGSAPDISNSSSANDLIVEYSLIGDTIGSGVAFTAGAGNILDQLPLLGPLADNGGSTLTHALLAGSRGINVGSNAILNAAGLTTDQRGENRIQFGTVDIGAFESDLNERVLVVATNQDVEDQTDGFTSLREAITLSNEGVTNDTITFHPNVFSVLTTIDVSSQLPTITGELTIAGPGANLLTIDAQGGGDNVLDGNGFRIFEVNDGNVSNSIDVSISGLTLTGGDNTDSGGAIDNFENLALDRVAVVDNRARFGGGVSNQLSGVTTLTNSTIANNLASQNGGGIFTRNGLTATNVTISGNSAAGNGGAIISAGDSSGATLNLTNSTLTNNTGNDGLHFNSFNGPTIATFNNTIIDSSITGVGNNGTTLTGGNNLFASSDPGIAGTGNLFSQTSMLAPLADNGGPTLTHALLYGSPAIDAGNDAMALDENGNLLTTDQRGEARIRFGSVDIGALETEFDEVRSLVVTTAVDVGDPSDGLTSLREAIAFANDPNVGGNFDGDADGDGLVADTITFDASVFTGGDNSVIRLTQGELSISESLGIDGSSVGGVLITGDADDDDVALPGSHITDVSASFGGTAGAIDDLLDDNSRVLDFFGSGDLTLTGLTITGGRITDSYVGGGGIRFDSSGTFTLNHSTVSGNSTTGDFGNGGGINSNSGDVSLINSTVSGNTSGGGGGGIFSFDSTFLLINSTVTGNSASAIGGGIRLNANMGSLTLHNSILAGNTDNGTAPDLLAVGGAMNNLIVEHSLIGDTTGSGVIATTGTGNILNQSALLGTLADNGGPTLTHALLPSSPAIDAGSNALALDEIGNPLTTDQRGGDRIQFDTVDIGAVEFGFGEPFLLGDANQDGFVNFSDISTFISLLSGGDFLDEADINRDGIVSFDDIGPFISLLSNGNSQVLLGDANQDGNVNFSDIDPFISLLSGNEFLDEADIDRDGIVSFSDIGPFISVLSSGGSSQTLLGDVNQDTAVDFSDISPFISLLSGNTFQEEADIDRDGTVGFADVGPFVSLLASGGSAQSSFAFSSSVAPAISSGFVVSSQAIVAESPLISAASVVSVAEPDSVATVASPVAKTSQLPTVDVTIVAEAPVETHSRPVAFFPIEYSSLQDRHSSLRGSQIDRPLVMRHSLAGNTDRLDFPRETRDQLRSASDSVERSFSTAADLFDVHPESMDEVFGLQIEAALAELIE